MKIQDMTPEQLEQAGKAAEQLPPEVFRRLADLFRWAANQTEAAFAEKDGKKRVALMLEVGEKMEGMNTAIGGPTS